jgi:dTDP-4-dehydrorhamnose reductase
LNLSPDTSVLITGASGALGWTLACRLAPRCAVTGTYCFHDNLPVGVAPARLDLAEPDGIDDLLTGLRPRLIIHAAAMTDPDACERDPAAARAVNLDATTHIAGCAAERGARLIFISTDLVFDGSGGGYAEGDPARPLSFYGRTKLEAESAALGVPGAAVIRTSLIYGWGSPASGTFFSGLHARLSAGERVRLFTDQMRNPVLVDDLAMALELAVEHDLEGLYHAGGPEAVSRYDFGVRMCEVFGLDMDLMQPILMREFEYVAGRPLDSTLDISRFRSATGFRPLGVSEGLRSLRASMPD